MTNPVVRTRFTISYTAAPSRKGRMDVTAKDALSAGEMFEGIFRRDFPNGELISYSTIVWMSA
jgi:hypothetical protein